MQPELFNEITEVRKRLADTNKIQQAVLCSSGIGTFTFIPGQMVPVDLEPTSVAIADAYNLLAKLHLIKTEPEETLSAGRIIAFPRVTSEVIKPFQYIAPEGSTTGEVVEIRASGEWSDGKYNYPISIHLTTYPGCGVVPFMGDNLKITLEREYTKVLHAA